MSAPFKVRASSWGKLFDCAHSWEGTHILGLRMPSSPRALLGTGIHHGTAVFDAARVNGHPVSAADAVEQAVEKIVRPEDDIDWSADDLSAKDMQVIAATLVTKYCREVSPRYTFAAVEMVTTPMVIDCGGGMLIELTGTLDRARLRLDTGGKGISDVKTGGAAVQKGAAKTKGFDAQLGTYEILTEHTTGEIITEPGEIIGMKTNGTPEIATGEIKGAKAMMLGTPDEPGLIQYAAEMFRSGLFPPNPQSILCSPKYCARWRTCRFRDPD
jgi:hypothetical protein